jgi:hypothetical protein
VLARAARAERAERSLRQRRWLRNAAPRAHGQSYKQVAAGLALMNSAASAGSADNLSLKSRFRIEPSLSSEVCCFSGQTPSIR